MRTATLKERQAFLLALLRDDEMHHGTYIKEKVSLALGEHTEPEYLYSALDINNQRRYESILKMLSGVC